MFASIFHSFNKMKMRMRMNGAHQNSLPLSTFHLTFCHSSYFPEFRLDALLPLSLLTFCFSI